MNIKTLDIISSPMLIFGGPYSNLESLQALKKEAEQLEIKPEYVFCTGDIVAYCADSEASIQFIKNWGIFCILGNTEEQLRDEEDDCGCNFEEGSSCDLLSKQWYPKAKAQLSTSSLSYISTLPNHIMFNTLNGEKALFVHGSSTYISEFIFETDTKRIEEEFIKNDVDIIIAGHCGIPFTKIINIDGKQKYWINPGVIGMPANNGKLNTYFGVFDSVTFEYTQRELVYDHASTMAKMIENEYPKSYAKTVGATGYWPSEDVLPKELRVNN